MRKQTLSGQDNDLRYLLALSFIKDIGPVTAKRLLSAFRSPRRIFEASLAELADVEEVRESRAKRIHQFDSWDRIDEEIEAARQRNIKIIKYTDEEYPEPLKQLADAPTVLYARGNFIKEDGYAVAIVGSRRMTEYGRSITKTIAYDLASCGFTIVSGMARGIDTVAHRGALEAGGRSIAVLGCGLDRPYPAENDALLEALSGSGCAISEFPLGTPPNRENFPRRNRLISGLSLGVLVVEATIKSGSLITAHYALEQGKDIFAVPGSIACRNSEGTNALIKKGAKLVQKAEDILEELSPVIKGLLHSRKISGEKLDQKLDRLEINDEERAICSFLGDSAKHRDTISRELRIAPARLSGLLLNLEIKGVVKQTDGNNFYIL
ncbi:MAG: DNA-processing protein DprA [Nitrospirae bacterium]|nr:DNA-processing protein DprA [Nitrospirota bacterium]MCL5237632.1 DNA-processing protein DprA [Nitrospirota bacterium]